MDRSADGNAFFFKEAKSVLLDLIEDPSTRCLDAVRGFDAINIIWRSGLLCDVTIIIEGERFLAHKLMLAAASPYFRAMFTGDVRERESSNVSMQGISAAAFEVILEWIYTRKINLNVCNVEDTLVAASILQMKFVFSYCEDFLQNNLTPENCLGVMRLAEMYSSQKLFDVSKEFCQMRFCDIVASEEFPVLRTDELIEILKQDTLNVRNEEQVYNAVMIWLSYDISVRTPEMPKILEHVRLPLVDWSFLKQKVEASNVFQRDDCRQFLIEATQYQARLYHPDLVNFQFNSSSLRAQPRFSFVNTEYLYVVGGEVSRGRQLLQRVDRYHAPSGEWTCLPDLPRACRGPGAVVVNRVLYVVGGSDGAQSLQTTLALDTRSMRWRELAMLCQPRSSVTVATNGDCLYAFGGNTGYESVSSVERYDPSMNTWTLVKDMHMKRSMAASAYLNGYFYVMGGYDGIMDLAEVERYDIKADQWHIVAPMSVPRSMCCAAVLKGHLFVAGGINSQSAPADGGSGVHEVPVSDKCNSCLCEFESYEPRTDSWRAGRAAHLPFHRKGLGLAAVGHQLFALGGVTSCAGLGAEIYHDVLFASQPIFASSCDQASPWLAIANLPEAVSRFGCCSS